MPRCFDLYSGMPDPYSSAFFFRMEQHQKHSDNPKGLKVFEGRPGRKMKINLADTATGQYLAFVADPRYSHVGPYLKP